MSHTPHELADEFPDHVDAIHKLKRLDQHFAKLADRYHILNRDIHRAESGVEPTDDLHAEEMKRERLRLKDEIFALINAAA